MKFRPQVETLGERALPTLWAVPVTDYGGDPDADGVIVVDGDDTAPYAAMDPLYIDPIVGGPVLRMNGPPAPVQVPPPQSRSNGPYTEWGINIAGYVYWAWKNNQPEGG